MRAALAAELQRSAAEDRKPASGSRRLAFLFSGQGSQHAGMAAELYRYQPVFRRVVDRCAALQRPALIVSISDDAFATEGGVKRLLSYYPRLFPLERVMRAMMAIGMVERTNAGSKRWCKLERNAGTLPVNTLSRT